MLTLLPFALVIGVALLVILADLFWPRRDNMILGIGVVGLLAALAATLLIGPLPGGLGQLAEGGSIGDPALYTRDLLTALLDAVLISIALLTLLFAPDYLAPRKLPLAELSSPPRCCSPSVAACSSVAARTC